MSNNKFMIANFRLFMKLILSLLINFANFMGYVWIIIVGEAWSRLLFDSIFYGFTGLAIFFLLLVYKFKPLVSKTQKIIYWVFSILGISIHLWFALIFLN